MTVKTGSSDLGTQKAASQSARAQGGAAPARKRRGLRPVVVGVLVVVLVFSAGSMIFIKNFYDSNFPRHDEPKYSAYLRFSDVPAYQPTRVTFASGENTLAGYLYGGGNAKGLVVIAPGQGEGAETFLATSMYFVDQGWRVFSFDPTGTFASEGANMVGLPQARLDLAAALSYIESDASLKELPVMLYGHSWGGYAVAAVLNDTQAVAAVASISGFDAPMGILAEDATRELGVLGAVEYPFGWAYQYLRFGPAALVTAVDGINRTTIPVLIVHGSADEAIDYDGASIIAQQASITNPNVSYQTRSAEGQNGHNNLYRSEAAITYSAQKNQEYAALYEEYQGNVPDSVKADFYASVDRFQTSELDAEFMASINRFFESAASSPAD